MNPLDLTPSQLKRAAAIKDQIERLNSELRRILDGTATLQAASTKKRRMSTAAKQRIAAAQRVRWAKIRRAKTKTAAQTGKK